MRASRHSSTTDVRCRIHRVSAVTANSIAVATAAATAACTTRWPRPAPAVVTGTAIAANPAHAPASARPQLKITNRSSGPRRSDSMHPTPTTAAAAGP